MASEEIGAVKHPFPWMNRPWISGGNMFVVLDALIMGAGAGRPVGLLCCE
jgi:hypothetical protein